MSEHATQRAFIEWCKWRESRYPDLALIFAIPNGGQRNIVTAKKLKAEGVRAGIPDICLPIPRNGYAGFWIEFKHGKNKLSPLQAEFIERLRAYGHYVVVCYTSDDAIKVVERYLSGAITIPV